MPHGSPHQGGIVDLPSGESWFIGFKSTGFLGRVDYLEPVKWGEDGWPIFVLKVKGDSMVDDQIADGDYVVVKRQQTATRGQTVVALTNENEATLKRWYPEGKRIRLQPSNASMKPIYVTDARVLGVVVGVVRKLR